MRTGLRGRGQAWVPASGRSSPYPARHHPMAATGAPSTHESIETTLTRSCPLWWGAWYRTSWDSPWSDQTTSWPVDIRGRARTGRPRRQPQGPADAARDDPAGPRPQHRRRADLPGSLVGIAPDGTVHVSGDGGTIWSHRGSAGGAPEALTASGDQVYAAVDGKIVSSDDAGRTFRTRYQGS